MLKEQLQKAVDKQKSSQADSVNRQKVDLLASENSKLKKEAERASQASETLKQ